MFVRHTDKRVYEAGVSLGVLITPLYISAPAIALVLLLLLTQDEFNDSVQGYHRASS